MANAYNVIAPDEPGFPSQQFVDDFLNGIDDIPDWDDAQKLIDMGKEEAQKYIEEKFNQIKEQTEAYFQGITDSIERRMQPIEPLIEPPASLEDVIEYCKALAEYFTEPYLKMQKIVIFYTTFSAAAAQAITTKAGKMIPPGGIGGVI